MLSNFSTKRIIRIRSRAVLLAVAVAAGLAAPGALGAAPEGQKSIVLKNDFARQEFRLERGSWRCTSFSRANGADRIEVESDVFQILLFDGTVLTADDYAPFGVPEPYRIGDAQYLNVAYLQRPDRKYPANAPTKIRAIYSLPDDAPWFYKALRLRMKEGAKIDRLQIFRFSTSTKASRGGQGQPVFIGSWFFGVDYPGFYSRHSDGFTEPDFNYRHPYTIDFEGRDGESAPRDGLVTLFHFPGPARKQPDGNWDVVSKRAVLGVSRQPGDGAELALLDYISATRRPPRSYLHFNNWYSPEAKAITVDGYVNRVGRKIVTELAKHGAHLDAMVPDHGWQNGKTFDYIYQPNTSTHDPLPEVNEALEALGTKLGIWLSLDGTNSSVARGVKLGYRSAYAEGFERSYSWMKGKDYFDVLHPQYQQDLRKAIRFLIKEAKVDYIKHDFNHAFTSHDLTQRHAREACLDATLGFMEYERGLHPGIYLNYTNGAWFSPWWLQQAECIWMMSGDSGGNGAWPQLSLRDGATAYRDAWFFQSFNNPERCLRPVLPIANFMTHGILLSKRKPFTDFKDTLHDWSDYVVMYYARGTTLKELYISNELLDDDHWKVLGRASAWAQKHQDRLINTVYVGGDCAKGQAYGYVSWVGDRAILTVRNPDRRTQTLDVPFDASVYYRGEPGKTYRARAIYPYVEPLPWSLTSGKPPRIDIPGDSAVVYELEPGEPRVTKAIQARPLPAFEADLEDAGFALTLDVPDEEFMRYDLLVQAWGPAAPEITIDGKATTASRQQSFKETWTLAAYDLRQRRGQTLRIAGELLPGADGKLAQGGKVETAVWLIADRPVRAPAAPTGEALPFAISQHHRRVTQNLMPKTAIAVNANKRADERTATKTPSRN